MNLAVAGRPRKHVVAQTKGLLGLATLSLLWPT